MYSINILLPSWENAPLFLHFIYSFCYNYFTVFLGLKRKQAQRPKFYAVPGWLGGAPYDFTLHNDLLLSLSQEISETAQWGILGHSLLSKPHLSTVITKIKRTSIYSPIQLTKYICINEFVCASQYSCSIDVMIIIILILRMRKLEFKTV